MFVKLDIPDYDILTFSDYHKSYTLNGTTYQGLGQLLSISDTASSLRATGQELTISISGVPDGNIADVLTTPIKGSSLTILRAFFDSTTGALLSIAGNPVGKFNGVISNYTIADDLGEGDRTGSLTITFVATNVVDLLNNKVTGRRTNPLDEKEFYPTDQSFDRVPSLAQSNFNFGAPQ
jgi:hypothetical protein